MEEKREKTVDEVIAHYSLKLIADKILHLLLQIRNEPDASAKRWIWELLQNAKDVPNRFGKVSVEVELVSPEELQFRHNGDKFSIENITGLVQQVSSKDSQNQEGQTGKFGTGFICTHLLADVIDVEGIVNYKGEDRRFKIDLDRSGYRSEDLLPRIESSLEILRHIETEFDVVEDYEQKRTEDSYDTVFTYHLKTPENQKAAIAGLEDLINTLPITLVTQSKKIKRVRVINRINNTDVTYNCDTILLEDNVHISTVTIGSTTKKYLSYITDDVALTTEINASEQGGYKIVRRNAEQPVLYRDFPLIGSEKFYFPYTLNGFNFNPTERRNGLILNSREPNSNSNREIVDKAVDAALKFNEWLISYSATNRFLLASSRIPEPPVRYSDDVSKPWIEDLQKRWRQQLLNEKLVETPDGTDFLYNLSVPCFTNSAKKEVNETFYKLLSGHHIGRGVLPAFEYLHGWLEVIRPEYETWGTKLKYEKDDFLKDLSDSGCVVELSSKTGKTTEETIGWLNCVYKFLIEQDMLKEFDNYAIIPNQNGDFKPLKELRSDHTSRIPSVLKDIYNSVNNDAIQDKLMDEGINADVFGNTLRSFSLKEMIEELNNSIKSGDNITKDGKTLDVPSTIAHSLLSLYPNTEDRATLDYRKTIYGFCRAYRTMPDYRMINTAETDLWKEADNYWFKNSFAGIVDSKGVATIAVNFFTSPKTEEETLSWLDSYIKFYRDHSHGDLIKEQAVFPNQQLELKKLSDLHYDSGIPEPFKDLASIAKNTSGNDDMYRHQLIHRSIHGYEQHDPLSTKDVYKFVKDRFDESNDTTKEVIARRVISILVKAGDSEPEERKLYDFAKTIFEDSFEEPIYVAAATDFHWRFAQEFYIKRICSRIVQSVNIDGLRKLSSSFGGKDKAELIDWIDTLIEFIHGYKDKKFWKIITDKDAGIGIWLNQNDDFCKFQDVREDNNIPEDLKDVAKNRHVNKDFREELFSLDSKCSQYLETSPMSISEIGQYIDGKIKEYEGDKQNNDYRSLIFNINRLYKTYPELEKAMPYFMEKKNSLIVGSLEEGETMDFVASIVQQGNEKIKVAKKILEKYTLEELNDILENKSKPKGPRVGTDGDQSGVEKIQVPKKLLEQYTHKQLNDILENIDKLTVPIIGTEDEPWGGLTKEEMHRYLEEAKDAILDRLSEAGYDISKADWDGWTCVDGVMKDGKEYPLVIRSNRSGRNTTITPKDWMQLMRDNAMFVVKTSNGIGTIRLRDMLRAKDYITIRFSSENLDNEQHINDLFSVFTYFKRIQIDFERFVEPVIGEWLRFVAPEKRTGEKAIPSSRQALPK